MTSSLKSALLRAFQKKKSVLETRPDWYIHVLTRICSIYRRFKIDLLYQAPITPKPCAKNSAKFVYLAILRLYY